MDMDEMEHTVAFSEEAPVNLSLRAEPTDFPSPSLKRSRNQMPNNDILYGDIMSWCFHLIAFECVDGI